MISFTIFALDFCDYRIYLHTMQQTQSIGHCSVFQYSCDDCILVYGHFACTLFVSCGICVQQNSMDENWILLLWCSNTFINVGIVTSCRKRSWFIYSSCGKNDNFKWMFRLSHAKCSFFQCFRFIYSSSDMLLCAPTDMMHFWNIDNTMSSLLLSLERRPLQWRN